jgi:hypothetical protein
MKAFELELGELFDFEGLISILLMVPVLFLGYYTYVYPKLSQTHYEEIFQQANGEVFIPAGGDIHDCGYMEAVTASHSLQVLPDKPTPNSLDEKKPSIDLTIRAPKYFSSFLDTQLEMQIKNKTQQTR